LPTRLFVHQEMAGSLVCPFCFGVIPGVNLICCAI
jgi:hypothetical protein